MCSLELESIVLGYVSGTADDHLYVLSIGACSCYELIEIMLHLTGWRKQPSCFVMLCKMILTSWPRMLHAQSFATKSKPHRKWALLCPWLPQS